MFRLSQSLSVSLLMLLPVVAGAQWSSDPAAGVRLDNGEPSALTLSGFQDQSGGAIFHWNNFSSSSSTPPTTTFQRVDAAGYPLWYGEDVNDTRFNTLNNSNRVTVDADGNTYLMHTGYDLLHRLMYVYKFSPQGESLWPVEGVRACTISSGTHKEDPGDILANDDGTLTICWSENHTEDSTALMAQKFSATGQRLWGDTGIVVASTDQGASTRMASDGAGGAILIWSRFSGSPRQSNLYAQRLNPAGAKVWGDTPVVVCNAAKNQNINAVVSDGEGGVVALWEDTRGPQEEIYVQRLDPAGNAVWQANGIPFTPNNRFGHRGRILVQEGYAWILCEIYAAAGNPSTYLQKRDLALGQSQFPGIGLTVSSKRANYSDLATDDHGGVVVAWTYTDDDSTHTVSIQRLTADGQPVWPAGGMPVCTAPKPKRNVVAVPMGDGNTIVGWVDERLDEGGGGTYGRWVNPYAAYVLPTGELLGTTTAHDWQLWQ